MILLLLSFCAFKCRRVNWFIHCSAPGSLDTSLSHAAVLQDIGFTLEESSTEMGLLMASKDRDAVEAQQVAAQIFLAAIVAALGGRSDPVWEKNQKIRISIATRPVNSSVVVRATVQRVIWNTKNQLSRIETIEDPQIYMQFFDKLSLAVFLEAHKI